MNERGAKRRANNPGQRHTRSQRATHKGEPSSDSERPQKEKLDRRDWGEIWFNKLAKFHGVRNAPHWQFTQEHVVAYLRDRKNKGMPTWKRLKIVEGLICYRNQVLRSDQPRLEGMRATLQNWIIKEKYEDDPDAPTMDEVVGVIDPNEPEALQVFRKRIRLDHL